MIHPFVWTTAAERDEVMANVNDPVWARFLDEATAHFARFEKPTTPNFPVFCHNGDLDEVMGLSVLAYVSGERKYWEGIAGWLRGMIAYFNTARPYWERRMTALLAGKHVTDANPRAIVDCFTAGGAYWVEAGFMSSMLHLYDLLEAEAPDLLADYEKRNLEVALAHFAIRFAFHEETLKYDNRGLWANAGLLISSLVHDNPDAARLLQHRVHRRYEEFRSTFLDDGMHGEGAPGYHGMSVDGVLCFALIASHVWPEVDYYGATTPSSESPFLGYPSFTDIVDADIRTLMPAPAPMYNPRGVSTYSPMGILPSMLHAYRLSQDPELGWLIRQAQREGRHLPRHFPVTPHTALGLGQYTPFLNFWLSRPVTETAMPVGGLSVLPDHGTVFSRSGWHADASCVWARFGYEGTGKGHRDCEHVGITLGGKQLLADPYPRVGPEGHDSSLFHNTVTIDCIEPPATIGRVLCTASTPGADAFLLHNTGGKLPNRAFLHDPRDEAHYWFTKQPVENAPFSMKRAVLHIHEQCAILVDHVERPVSDLESPCIDWFFHTDFCPEGYDGDAKITREFYQLAQTIIVQPPQVLPLELRGTTETWTAQRWHTLRLGDNVGGDIRAFSFDADLTRQIGHHCVKSGRYEQGIISMDQVDYFLRFRTNALSARVAWVFSWGGQHPEVDAVLKEDGSMALDVTLAKDRYFFNVNQLHGTVQLTRTTDI